MNTFFFINLHLMFRPALILLIAFIFSTLTCTAQCPSDKYQWDLSVSYGYMNTGISYTDASQNGNKTIARYPQPAFFTVRYFLYNRLAIGVATGVASEQGKYFDPNNLATQAGTYSASSTTVAIELYYVYHFWKYVEVYTFAGAGPSFANMTSSYSSHGFGFPSETTSNTILKGQYTPLGIRFGGRLGAYAEVGYGYKGIVNAGISFKLGPTCWWKDDFR